MSSPYLNPEPKISETVTSQFKKEKMSYTYAGHNYKRIPSTITPTTPGLGSKWVFDYTFAEGTRVDWSKAKFVVKYKTLTYTSGDPYTYNYLDGSVSGGGVTAGFAPGMFPEAQFSEAKYSINYKPVYENSFPAETAMCRAMVDGNALDSQAMNGIMPYDGSGETAVDSRIADSSADTMIAKRKNHLIATKSIVVPVKSLIPMLGSPEPYYRKGKHHFELQYMQEEQYFLHRAGYTALALDYEIYLILPECELSNVAQKAILPYEPQPVIQGFTDVEMVIESVPVGVRRFKVHTQAQNVSKIAIYVEDLPFATTYVASGKGYATNKISASNAEITSVKMKCGSFTFDTDELLQEEGDRVLNSWMLTRSAQNPHIVPYITEQTFRNMPILVIDLLKYGWDEKQYLLYGEGSLDIAVELSATTTTAPTNVNIGVFKSELHVINEEGKEKALEG